MKIIYIRRYIIIIDNLYALCVARAFPCPFRTWRAHHQRRICRHLHDLRHPEFLFIYYIYTYIIYIYIYIYKLFLGHLAKSRCRRYQGPYTQSFKLFFFAVCCYLAHAKNAPVPLHMWQLGASTVLYRGLYRGSCGFLDYSKMMYAR